MTHTSAVAWLRAQITADANAASNATTCAGTWTYADQTVRPYVVTHAPTGDDLATFAYPGDARHAVAWQPSRVLRECAAKLALVDLGESFWLWDGGMAYAILAPIADIYRDRPGFPDAFLPDGETP